MGEILINEFLAWFSYLAEKGQVLPKVLSGVLANGEQFFLYPYDLPIESSEHLDFMRTVLLEEKAIGFVVSYRFVSYNEDTKLEDERRTFFSGEMGKYFTLEVAPQEGGDWSSGVKILQKEQSSDPIWFLGDLLTPPKDKENEKKFHLLWNEVRPKIQWMKRDSDKSKQ